MVGLIGGGENLGLVNVVNSNGLDDLDPIKSQEGTKKIF